jgi:hypothetical protein
MMITPYPKEVESQMKTLYESLSEKDRRRYAAIEAAKLGRGGHRYLVDLLGCDYKTIRRGLDDLKNPPDLPRGRVRKKGGPKGS